MISDVSSHACSLFLLIYVEVSLPRPSVNDSPFCCFMCFSVSHVHGIDTSRKHYGHSGIVEAARDLFMQIEGDPKFGGTN